MSGEEKNLKDTQKDTVKDTVPSPVSYQAGALVSISYAKTHKLITALYMVTDIIDKNEPLRNKLRTLGVEIISDIYHTPSAACIKISEVMSFLDIASTMDIISKMNCNILKKEFLGLDQSIKESNSKPININKQIDLSEFFVESPVPISPPSKGHTRIGVQKGSTLMKVLSDKLVHTNSKAQDFDVLKKQRRGEITDLIQKKGGSATITDIKDSAYGSLSSCGEKTLQRELVSMAKDGVLKKTGEKRWSKYSLNTLT